MRYAIVLLFICLASIGWDAGGGWNRGVLSPNASRYLTEKAVTSDTLTASESGKTLAIDITSDSVFILPAASPGLQFTFVASDDDVIKIDPATTADTIMWAVSSAPLSAGDKLQSPGATGDSVTLISVEANKWVVKDMRGSWVDGN